MQANTKTNSKATTSLSFGILSIIIPYIGMIIGVLGFFLSNNSMKEIEVRNEGGKGLATAGKVCSVVGITLHTVLIILLVMYYATFSLLEPQF